MVSMQSNQVLYLRMNQVVYLKQTTSISFWYKVSSESNYDFLNFILMAHAGSERAGGQLDPIH